jgi:hypothetical protein
VKRRGEGEGEEEQRVMGRQQEKRVGKKRK